MDCDRIPHFPVNFCLAWHAHMDGSLPYGRISRSRTTKFQEITTKGFPAGFDTFVSIHIDLQT